jgi:hypothetical protein
MADFWDELFDESIPLPDGSKLITLRDAGDYIARLPKTLHDSDRWQLAIKDLMRAATVQVEWRVFARLAIMKALYGKTPPPIGAEKRVKKRDQWKERRRNQQR